MPQLKGSMGLLPTSACLHWEAVRKEKPLSSSLLEGVVDMEAAAAVPALVPLLMTQAAPWLSVVAAAVAAVAEVVLLQPRVGTVPHFA